MLCKRIIGAILIDNGFVVRRQKFKTTSIIGRPEVTIDYLQNWNVDEIFFINVGNKTDISSIIEYTTKNLFLPITVGGSISSKEDAKKYFMSGADKIVLGKNATKELCEEISSSYGNQAVCVSIDENHEERLKEVNEWSIGEIIMHDKERDGIGEGLNLDILKHKSDKPIIAMGGVGDYTHIVDGLKLADAVAVGNLFHFKEIAAVEAKKETAKFNMTVRP